MICAVSWELIPPKNAVDLVLPIPTVVGPRNEMGEPCPWPWDPQQLVEMPIGQYHCGYCGAMVVAGVSHLDYSGINELMETR